MSNLQSDYLYAPFARHAFPVLQGLSFSRYRNIAHYNKIAQFKLKLFTWITFFGG